jgi:hypothetical protein
MGYVLDILTKSAGIWKPTARRIQNRARQQADIYKSNNSCPMRRQGRQISALIHRHADFELVAIIIGAKGQING